MKLNEIAEIQTGPFGSQLHEEDYVLDGTPIVTVEHLGERVFSEQNLPKVSEKDTERLGKFLLKEGDIVFSRVGSVDRCSFVDKKHSGWLFSGRCLRVRPTAIDALFLYYFFKLESTKKSVSNMAVGAIMDSINTEIMGNVILNVPMHHQKERVHVLDLIDSKLEKNNAIISELESMAKDIYDYWFVQFDFPDENGKPYKSSGGKMVWNEELKREIPEGWESHALCEYIRESKNGDWGNESPKCDSDLAVRCFRGADFPAITSNYCMTAPIRFITAKNRNRLLSEGDLIVEISGGSPTQSTGRIGYVNAELLSRSEYPMDCSNFCKAFSPTSISYTYWMYNTWSRLYDASVLFNYESKTTGIKNLMFDDFTKSMKVAVPPEDLLVRFHKLVCVLYSKIQILMKESSELASLRDWLLPMLMNGQVKVGGVE